MRRKLLGVLCLALIAGALPSAAAAEPIGRYIVVLKAPYDPASVANEHARLYGESVSHVYSHAIKGYAAVIPEARLSAVESDPRVAYVSQDSEVHATAQTVPTGISRTFAPTNANLDIDGTDDKRVDVDVAIIDTGIDLSHPDLNVVGGRNCQNGNSYADGNGHGSHVAGTVAALDNGIGPVGMAPGARLWAVRVLNNAGSGSWSSVICGIDWVTGRNTDGDPTNDIEVANMSLGGSGSDGTCGSSALHQAICTSVNANVTYAVAAGNDSANASTQVPAAYDQVITVSALADFNGLPGGGAAATCRSDVDDTFANFSNYGSDVDIIAPGVCIYSTWKGGAYNTISGTSMAAPHVTGAAALYRSGHPSATPSQVQSALMAAGNLSWTNTDDKDATKERLLDVSDAATFAPTMILTGPPPPPVDAPPTATGGSATTDQDTPVVVGLGGSDAETCELAFSVVSGPSDGTLSAITDSACTGVAGAFGDTASVTYTPNGGYSGPDSFTFKVNDGTNDSSASVNITVNAPPPSPGAYELSAVGYRVKGWHYVDLSWSPSGMVAVFRNGSFLGTVSGTGYTDPAIAKGGATYSYVVCQSGTSNCSAPTTVTF